MPLRPAPRFCPRKISAWTLIEVMVALVLMASITALGYRSLSTLITTETALREESEFLLVLDTSFSLVENDWKAQAAQLATSSSSQPPQTSDNQPSADQTKTSNTSTDTPASSEPPASTPFDISPETVAEIKLWKITPINGWIPSPTLLPKAPPAIEPLLTTTYSIDYQVNPQGGVNRLIGCTVLRTNANSPRLCQRWHLLKQLPVEITDTQNEKLHTMNWVIQSRRGNIQRQWSHVK
ncbi:MAG: hypothetical protein V4525_14520 [Pseudomonadota bacterium]